MLIESCRHGARFTRTVLVLACLAAPAAMPAAAGDRFDDARSALTISDDARFFLDVTRRHFGGAETVAVDVLRRCPHPGSDFPVVMLLAQASGRRAETIASVRQKGLAWSDVMARLQIPPDRLFAGLDRDPGPPYGNAWGHWKKAKRGRGPRDPREAPVFDDLVVADLARLQIAVAALRVSPYTIIAERQKGVGIDRFVVIRSRPSGTVAAKSAAKGPRPERGLGKDQDRPAHARSQRR